MCYWLYDRPLDADAPVASTRSSRAKPELGRGEHARAARRATTTATTTEVVPGHATRCRRRSSRPGIYRNITGQRGARAGLRRGGAEGAGCRCSTAAIRSRRPATSCTSCSMYKNFGVDHVPGRGRDRRHRRRRSAPRSPARSASPPPAARAWRSRARRSASRVMTELPLVDRRRPARRPVDRPADQDRAGRPAAGALRPQRRGAGAGHRRRARPATASDVALEACRIALKYMTPVILLSDGYLANGAEPWRIPELDELPEIPVTFRTEPAGLPALRARRRRRWRGRGPSRARRASSTASAASRSRTSPATSATTPENHEQHGARCAPRRSRGIAQRHPATPRSTGDPRRRPAGRRLGRHVRRDHRGACGRQRATGQPRRPRRTCAT